MGIDIKPSNLQNLLQQELTRKQFIQMLGVMVVSLLGFNNLISMLAKMNHSTNTKKVAASAKDGFGSSKFGI